MLLVLIYCHSLGLISVKTPLVPMICESKDKTYFSALQQISTALAWPPDVWAIFAAVLRRLFPFWVAMCGTNGPRNKLSVQKTFKETLKSLRHFSFSNR